MHVTNMGIFQRRQTLQKLLMAPKAPLSKKDGVYIDSNVTGWIVMKSILGNLQEHLERGSKNTPMSPPLYMTITRSQVIP